MYNLESLPSGAVASTKSVIEVKYGQSVTLRFMGRAAKPTETRAPWMVPPNARQSEDIPAKATDTKKAIALMMDAPVESLVPTKANGNGTASADNDAAELGTRGKSTRAGAAGAGDGTAEAIAGADWLDTGSTGTETVNAEALPGPASPVAEQATTISPMKKVAYGALITGGALMTVGLIQELRANSFSKDVDKYGPNIAHDHYDYAHNKYDQFKTASLTGWVFLGIGAAASLYGGGYLILAPSTNGGQAVFSGSF